MKVLLDREGSSSELVRCIKQLESDATVKGIMILSCDANGITPEKVDSALRECTKPIWGGIFPGLLYEKERLERGSIVAGLHQRAKTTVLKNISDPDSDQEDRMEEIELEDLENSTMFVYIDGLSPGVERVKDTLFDHLGLTSNYIGGGGGSLSFVQRPCIFTNEGLLADAAVLSIVDAKSGIGVAHGWQPVSEALKITEVDRNRVISINWKPAFAVYKEIVEALSGMRFAETGFFELAKAYPLGIVKMAKEMVVRDPIEVKEDKDIICVGEIPANSFVYVLHGDKDSLLQGAKDARTWAENSFSEIPAKESGPLPTTVFIDCISRVLFLQDDFPSELEAVHRGGQLIGALTLGEMANTGKFYLEFYNKTSVVCLLEG